jgi:hypothetical protein
VTKYTIEQGLGVRERMNPLAAVAAPTTPALLDSLGVAEGARCIDLGCGADTSRWSSAGEWARSAARSVSTHSRVMHSIGHKRVVDYAGAWRAMSVRWADGARS